VPKHREANRTLAFHVTPKREVAGQPGCKEISTGCLSPRFVRSRMNARFALSELGCSSEYEVARYRLGWPSSIHLQPLPRSPKTSRWLLVSSRAALAGLTNAIPTASSSHELSLSLRATTPETLDHRSTRRSRQLGARRPLGHIGRSLCHRPNSPHEVSGPFSTSSREDSLTRISTSASFRLRRFCDLDGFLPSRPCPLFSSGGTLGVPGGESYLRSP